MISASFSHWQDAAAVVYAVYVVVVCSGSGIWWLLIGRKRSR